MASLRERARKQRPSLRTGERLDSVAESVVNHSVSPAAPADSILPADTLTDSEILALDSMPPAPRKSRIVREKVDIDNAVDFAAKDSLVMLGQNAAFMYGASSVKYTDIDLSADEIHMDMKESLVYAVGRKDTTDEVVGSPVFKDRSGEYQSKTMTYNTYHNPAHKATVFRNVSLTIAAQKLNTSTRFTYGISLKIPVAVPTHDHPACDRGRRAFAAAAPAACGRFGHRWQREPGRCPGRYCPCGRAAG